MAQAYDSDGEFLSRRLLTERVRTVLPVYFGESLVLSIPDSGSEENIISKRLVEELGLTVFDGPGDCKEFRLADGKVTVALGRVEARCSYIKNKQREGLLCTFFIFQNLISDLIMGMVFLDSTKTLTKNRHCLKKQKFLSAGLVQICGINNPRRRVHCTAFHKPVLANADTGSDMNLISLAYARSRSFELTKVDDKHARVQFADGRIAHLSGKVEIPFIIWDGVFKRMQPTFYVLENLTCPLLIGEALLAQTDAFRSYRTAMTLDDDGLDIPEVSTILWFNTPERFLSKRGHRHVLAPEPLSNANEAPPIRPLTKTMRARIAAFMSSRDDTASAASAPIDLPFFEKRLKERDARELHRRELAKRAISQLDSPEAAALAQTEEDARIADFETHKELVVRARTQAAAGDPMAGSGRRINNPPRRLGSSYGALEYPATGHEDVTESQTAAPEAAQRAAINPEPAIQVPEQTLQTTLVPINQAEAPLPKQNIWQRLILKLVL